MKSGEYLLRRFVINILSFQKMTNSSQNESRLPAVVFPMIVLWGGKNNDSTVISEIKKNNFFLGFLSFSISSSSMPVMVEYQSPEPERGRFLLSLSVGRGNHVIFDAHRRKK